MTRPVPPRRKRSALAEVSLGPWGWSLGEGWEQGEPGTAPTTPDEPGRPPAEGLQDLAQALRDEARSCLALPDGALALHVSAAIIDDGGVLRRVAAARLAIGDDPDAPLWERAAPLGPGAGGWPAGWLDAVRREVGGWDPRLGPQHGPFRGAESGIAVDAFALADIVRLAAAEWFRGPVSRVRVAAPALDIRDEELFAPEPPATAGPPSTVVRAGLLVGKPGDPGGGSWRGGAGPAWRHLVVEPGGTGLPDAEWWLTRVVALPGALLGAGFRRAGPGIAGRWGPEPIPPPGWWLRNVVALAGPAVPDATGLPVSAPVARVNVS
ncbi:MAG: hypothetical protein KBD01_03680 [Acidobacteria bacterium]|nr:hypothetical protein [Acidobacteriota bacterium]